MSRLSCAVAAICASVVVAPPLAVAATEDSANADIGGYLCVPDDQAADWVCSAEADPEASLLSWNKTSSRRYVPAENATTPRGETGLASARNQENPDDWFQPAPTSVAEPSYGPVQDLAVSLLAQAPEQASAGGTCRNVYATPALIYPADADDTQYPIIAEADRLTGFVSSEAELSGNVSVEQGNRVVRGQRVLIDQETRIARFPEGVRMTDATTAMQGAQATVNLNSREASISQAQFVLREARLRGAADTLQQSPAGDLTLTDTSFTHCEPGNNGWRLDTSSLEIEQDEVFGTARNAVLRMKNVPVFYTPYLKFPVSGERVSGFLFPNLSYSDEDGIDVSLPYYLNLAPNYDATVIPRFIGERGVGAEVELRHMSSWQQTTLSGAFLPEDDLYNGVLDRDDFRDLGGAAVLGEFEPADRWLGGIKHAGQFGAFRTSVDFTSVSDRDYFRDLGSDLAVSSRIELARTAEIQYSRGGLIMRAWAQRFQRLDEITRPDYERLPELEMVYRTNFGLMELSLGSSWSQFDRDTDGLDGLLAVTGERFHVEPRVDLPFSWPFGFLNFGAGYRYSAYSLEQDPNAGGFQLTDDEPDRSIGTASIDGGLFFERDISLFNSAMIQTLEPRVQYLWQEFEDQSALPNFDSTPLTFGYSQLFRTDRFSGLDRLSDSDRASVGVTTRFLSAATGQEYFSASIGQTFYFKDRRVGTFLGEDRFDSSSSIVSDVRARIANRWSVRGTLVWNPHDNRVNEGGAYVRYRRDNRHLFNVGFRNRRTDFFDDRFIEQSDVSVYWPIGQRMAVIGRWNFDLRNKRTIEGFGGLEYSDCCLQVRLIARRFLDAPTVEQLATIEADEGIFLQIVFKGLAGFGTKVESVLERGIHGYRSPQSNSFFAN